MSKQLPDVTLDWLLARTREDSGHLIWTCYIMKSDQPQVRIDWKLYLVRRLVWELVHEGRTLGKRWAGTSCGVPGCVHPDHVTGVTRSKRLKGIPIAASHKRAIAMARRRNSDLTDDQVAAIRLDTRTNIEIAADHGIDHTYVSKIKLGKTRHDYRNPFVVLGAR